MLYDQNSVRLLLGCLLIKPSLAISDKYPLTRDDFTVDFHLRLWQGCVALAKRGAESISALDLYMLCKNNKQVEDIFKLNQLDDFIDTVKQLANVGNVEVYYNNTRRATLLRSYKNAGYNIDKFEQDDKATIEDIVQYFDAQQIAIKKQFYKDKDIDELKAGDGFEAVKEGFKAEPLFGATTFSEYLNTAARGWIPGQLSIYSVGSGVGKSTIGLANLVQVCCPRIYDIDKGQYVDNPCYQHKAGLYLQFEMAGDTEITPKIVATISGVPCFSILNGRYEEGEEERVDEAIKILHESKLYIVTMPNYTVDLIESYVKDYVVNKQVSYVCYDYITESSSVSSNIAKKNGVSTRSDQVLAAIASKLKDLAVEYNIAVLSFTQVSDNVHDRDILDSSVAAGCKSIKNKADVYGVIMPLRKKEQDIADMMLEKFPNKTKPNRCLHMDKMRFSAVEQGIKIYFYLDLNTGRYEDCFVTTKYDQPMTLTRTRLFFRKNNP